MASGDKPSDSKSTAGGSKERKSGTARKTGSTPTAGKRPVTIDLKAEEVASKASETSASDTAASSKPDASDTAAPKPAPEAQGAKGAVPEKTAPKAAADPDKAKPGKAEVSAAKPSDTVKPAAETGKKAPAKDADKGRPEASGTPSEKPLGDTKPAGDSHAAKDAAPASDAKPDKSAAEPNSAPASKSGSSASFANPPAANPQSGSGLVGGLIAAVIGGVLALGGAYGLLQAGVLNLPSQTDGELARGLSAAESRLAELETLMKNAEAPAAAGVPAALETRIAGLEAKLETATGSPEDGIDSLESSLTALQSELSALRAGIEDGSALPPVPEPKTVDLAPLEDRIARLETTARSTANTAGTLDGEVDGLSGQIAGLRSDLSGIEARITIAETNADTAEASIAASETSAKTLADAQAELDGSLASLSSELGMARAANKTALAGLRAQLNVIGGRLAAVEAEVGDATAREVAARALSVAALKSAVDAGQPYEAELAAVKVSLPPETDLTALERFAKSGIEPVPVLIAQFPEFAREMHATFGQSADSGDLFGGLLSGARSIVSVRGPGDAGGAGPEATLRQMERAVADGNLRDALKAFRDLPEAARTAGRPWVARTRARIAADNLANKTSRDVLQGLAEGRS